MKFASVVGTLAFIAFVVAAISGHLLWATRIAGFSCLACGFVWMRSSSIPVGIEGRPPSFFITGRSALLLGLLMATLGLAAIVFAARVGCLLGWIEGSSCA